MKTLHSGFVADSGVQQHSAGDDFPITHYCVGNYPRVGNGAYWVVAHPSGAKRWTWTAKERDRIVEAFKEASEWAEVMADFSTVSERTAFEVSLLGVEKRDKKQYGWELRK